MNPLKLRVYPDPILLKPTQPVKQVKDNHIKTAIRMHELMKALGGLGLAAPQVGVPYSVIVINTIGYEHGVRKTMFNPVIDIRSHNPFKFKEGCLSFPNEFKDSERDDKIWVTYINSQGTKIQEEFRGISAACIQHEIDHLHGILFKD